MRNDKNSTPSPWRVFDKPSKNFSRTVLAALLLTLFFHLLIALFFPAIWKNYLNKKGPKQNDPIEVVFEPLFENQQRFVETNHNLAPEEPPKTNNFAAQSQVAAQEIPTDASPSSFPELDGDLIDANKIIQGSDIDLDPIIGNDQPLVSPHIAQTPDIPQPLTPIDDIPIENQDGVSFLEEKKNPENDILQALVRPSPKPRPQLKKSIVGPLMKSQGSASKPGILGVDAQFSQFGEYLQRLSEVLGAQWRELIYRQGVSWQNVGTTVVIQFSLNFNGDVNELKVLSSNSSLVAELLCKDAILARAPYGPWTKEMRMTLGKEKTITIGFMF